MYFPKCRAIKFILWCVCVFSSCSTAACCMTCSRRTTGSGGTWYKPDWHRSLETSLRRTLTGCSMWEGWRGLNVYLFFFFKLFFWVSDLTCCLSLQECCSSHAGMWYLKGTIQSWHWEPAPCGHRRPIKSSPRCPVRGQSDRWEPITARPALRAGGWRTRMSAVCSARNVNLFSFELTHFWH